MSGQCGNSNIIWEIIKLSYGGLNTSIYIYIKLIGFSLIFISTPVQYFVEGFYTGRLLKAFEAPLFHFCCIAKETFRVVFLKHSGLGYTQVVKRQPHGSWAHATDF